jgi:hypothetical protein
MKSASLSEETRCTFVSTLHSWVSLHKEFDILHS